MTTIDLSWDPPANGVWWLPLEHCPKPVSTLFAAVFPPVTRGWSTGRARYGLPAGRAQWAAVNGWMYFNPGEPDYSQLDKLEHAAAQALATREWREEVRRWFEDERPRVIEASLRVQSVDLEALDDRGLAAHFVATVAHFDAVAPLHFEHVGFDLACGLLLRAAGEWGIDARDVFALLAGSSPGSHAAVEHLDRVVATLREVGAEPPPTLEAVRAASSDAAAALDEYLTAYGWRSLEGNEVSAPTLGEKPEVVAASIRARMTVADSAVAPVVSAETVRSRVPAAERARFDELLDDARLTYQLRDDDGGVCYSWPLGLVRRAALEVGRRLVGRGSLADAADVFEGTPDEITALLDGSGPSAEELAGRAARLRVAANVDPPVQLGEWHPAGEAPPLPPNVATLAAARDLCWAAGGKAPQREPLRGTGVGTGVYRGRACIISGPESMTSLQVGDVLVARTTMSCHNGVFPIAGAVVTEEGGLHSHTAVLARELGLPAVVGVFGLLSHVRDGDTVEVDATAGAVRVVDD